MRAIGNRPASQWRDRRLLDLCGIEHPIVLAPMAGFGTPLLAAAVSRAGGLGSLGCATLTPAAVCGAIEQFRKLAGGPININFFCHQERPADAAREIFWRDRLKPYYCELGLDASCSPPEVKLPPFDSAMCRVIEQQRPEVVSFHFGLPEPQLLARVKAVGSRILSSATTPEEALWLVMRGVDAVIAQGREAGGHQGSFLDGERAGREALSTFDLLRAIVSTTDLPVIAAGGLVDAADMATALSIGAAGVQLGTAFLLCPEAATPQRHRAALTEAHRTVMTNVFTGRMARAIANRLTREVGPVALAAPNFPAAASAIAPLRAEAERLERNDFSAFWAGATAPSVRDVPAETLTRSLARDAVRIGHTG